MGHRQNWLTAAAVLAGVAALFLIAISGIEQTRNATRELRRIASTSECERAVSARLESDFEQNLTRLLVASSSRDRAGIMAAIDAMRAAPPYADAVTHACSP